MRITRARARAEGISLATEEESAAAVQTRRRKNQRRQQHVQRPAGDANGNDWATPETLTRGGMRSSQPEPPAEQGEAIGEEDSELEATAEQGEAIGDVDGQLEATAEQGEAIGEEDGQLEATGEQGEAIGEEDGQLEATAEQGEAIEEENGQSSSRQRSRDSDQDDERESQGLEPDARKEHPEGEGEDGQRSSHKRSRESEQDDEGESEGPDAQKGRMEEGGERNRTPEEERRPPCEVLAERLAAWREVARAEAQANFDALQEGHEMFQETAFLAIASVTEAIAAAGGPAFALVDPYLTGIPGSAQRVLRPRHTVLYPAHRGGAHRSGGGHLSLYIIRGVDPEGAHSGHATRFQVEAHDSFGPTRNAALRVGAFATIQQTLQFGGWTGLEVGDPANDALFPNQIIAGEGVADQRAGWNCGYHTVLNAWAHALNLQTVAAGVRLGGRFNAVSVEMVNLAMQGFMDSATIEAFFLCYGYVAADQRVPLNRRFDQTRPFRRLEELQRFLAEQRLEEDLQSRRARGLQNGDEEHIPDLNEALNVIRMAGLGPPDLAAMGIHQLLYEYRSARDYRNFNDLFADGSANVERQRNAGLDEEQAINTAIEASLMNGLGSSQANRPPSDGRDQTANQSRPSSERAGSRAPQPNTQGNSNGTIQPRRDLENGEGATNPLENDERPRGGLPASNGRERQHRRRQIAWEGVAVAMADLSALDDAALENLRRILAIGIQDVASERARRAGPASDQPAASQGASQRHRRASGQGTPPGDNQSDSADSNLDATLAHLSQQDGWAARLDGEHRFRRRSRGPEASPLESRRRARRPGQTRGYRYPERPGRLRVERGGARHRPLPTSAGLASGWPAPRSVLPDDWWREWEPPGLEEWTEWLRRELDWFRSRKPPRRRADGSRAHPLEGDPLLRREYVETSSPE
ncbi:hypothetical protein KC343_g476 [Hortaea werneckii]|nr:hypothetical protein KC352_g7529 [Hortaea werneckii]KAI7572700.1 hypothetical protein KC317_g525 [Hortaea werneckii]KAI7625937.1 hypothetical protein KC346_g1510 [Hortaea werneckii]KAI7637867.1 hypothetical protein KC343_g476 [Hortaea werneckii]KAI7683935.1 hypothetical protein KC319_g196 [Hortaea werneckii]